MFYVYCITNNINNKIYIGKAKDVNQRWLQHKAAAKKKISNSFLYKAIRKYGSENFTIVKLEEIEDEELCYLKETELIKQFQANNPKIGYNMGLGGEGNRGKVITEETRKKFSERSKKNYTPEMAEILRKAKGTPEALKNASIASTGSKNPRANLTEDIVLEIRKLFLTGEYSQVKLSELFNIPRTTINHIIKRYTWKHI